MVQNHLLQLLCLIAMEPPSSFEPDYVRDEKLKVLRALAPITNPDCVVRGQYGFGIGVPSYLEDAGDRLLEGGDVRGAQGGRLRTGAGRGVPFYLRHRQADEVARVGDRRRLQADAAFDLPGPPRGRMSQNVLAIRLQPDEGIRLTMTIKDPGPGGMRLAPAELDMTFADTLAQTKLRMPDAYERLVMDVIRGDQTLFMRSDEVEAAWAWVDPIVHGWEERGDLPEVYNSFGRGPDGGARDDAPRPSPLARGLTDSLRGGPVGTTR